MRTDTCGGNVLIRFLVLIERLFGQAARGDRVLFACEAGVSSYAMLLGGTVSLQEAQRQSIQ
jgi:hypothetical protein